MLIVGLGNPGDKYNKTRHNIGFDICYKIIEDYELPKLQKKFHGFFTQGKIDGIDVKILLPQTYMNNSGIAVSEAANFYKEKLEDVIVIHDDLDLAFGKLKIKIGGGTGGHNGLKSIDAHLGQDYKRLRFGIDKPEFKEQVHSHVLNKFSSEEQEKVDEMVKKISKLFPILLKDGEQLFLTRYSL